MTAAVMGPEEVKYEITAEVTATMRQLGNLTPTGIALFLKSQGVKGRIGCSCECPLAVYLRELLAETLSDTQLSHLMVSVGANEICVSWYWGTLLDQVTVEQPAPVASFVRQFDVGAFGELVEARA